MAGAQSITDGRVTLLENTHHEDQVETQRKVTKLLLPWGLLLLALSDPFGGKKLEKFKVGPNMSQVHSFVPIKWAKDHVKTRSVGAPG